MKVIKSLENRGILLKGTVRKITSQEGAFLNFLRPLMKSVLTPLAKTNWIRLGLSEGMSAADAAIQRKIYRSGRPSDLVSRITALTISNEEIYYIIKIVKWLEESVSIIKWVSEIIRN